MAVGRVALLLGAASVLVCAQTPPASAAIHGIVRDASTGVPIADAEVLLLTAGSKPEATTDAEGLFTLSGLAPGPARIRVFHFFLGGNMTQEVNASTDPSAPPVEIRLRTGGHISGRVTDQEGKPIAGVFVSALRRVYSAGRLEYIRAGGDDSTTRDGQYYIDGLEAGHGYIIEAHLDRTRDAGPISTNPEDPALRKDIPVPTYYPSADSPERALAVPLESNDTRDHIDIRLLRSPSYCVSGTADLASLGLAGGAHLALTDRPPSVGLTQADLGRDGRFRICDLYPGEYSLALSQRGRVGSASGTASVTMLDRDVARVTVSPVAPFAITGEVAWDGTPPTLAPEQSFLMLNIGAPQVVISVSTRIAIPGPFSVKTPRFGEEATVQVAQLPTGAYVKEMLYNGATMPTGAAISGPGSLRIQLGTDGARINAKVSGKDGNPLPNISIAVFPAAPDSQSTLAATVRFGTTDSQGVWNSGLLAPGNYAVLATDSAQNQPNSFETIEALWLARAQAQTVDLAPGSTAPVTLTPTPLR